MGWTFQYRPPGQSDKDFFAKVFGVTKPDSSRSFLATATVGSTFYAAVAESKTGDVWALVVLINRCFGKADSWGHNFGYKDLDENMGPNEAQAPAKILDLLTPTDSKYAIEWREACRANLVTKAKAAKVKAGDTVVFAHPVRFSNGQTIDTFTFVKGNRMTSGYQTYNFSGWRTREFVVNPTTDASAEYAARRAVEQAAREASPYVRSSAVNVGGGNVKVTFRNEAGASIVRYMAEETYAAIPYGTDATVADYVEFGAVVNSTTHKIINEILADMEASQV